MDNIEKIRLLVKEAATENDWKFHISAVIAHAKDLAKSLGADMEIVEISAILHDIGRIRFGPDEHDMTGSPEAEKILKGYGYDQAFIDKIKHSVESHRGNKDRMPQTLEAKIIANADAMAHFDVIPFFFNKPGNRSFEEIFEWVEEKIKRNWERKLTIPEAKERMRDKYQAIKLVLESNKRLF